MRAAFRLACGDDGSLVFAALRLGDEALPNLVGFLALRRFVRRRNLGSILESQCRPSLARRSGSRPTCRNQASKTGRQQPGTPSREESRPPAPTGIAYSSDAPFPCDQERTV